MPVSVTLLLVVATALVSIAAFNDRRLFGALLFEPFVIKARGEWHRFLTHALIHANWPHLVVNMFVLHMFGRNVEMLFPKLLGVSSPLPFLGLYVGGILFSSLPSYRRHLHDPTYRAVGASGAVSAVLFAQVLILPFSELGFLFMPFDIPAYAFGALYLAYSWHMDKRGGDNIAHDAHFYGAVYGVLYMAVLRPDLVFDFGGFQRAWGI